MEQQKGFLESLQSLDETAKRKILIGATAVIMIVVVYFWLAYFNSIVVNLSAAPAVAGVPVTQSAPATAQTVPTPAASSSGSGVWQNIGAGFMSLVHGLIGIFQSQGQYTVQPQQ